MSEDILKRAIANQRISYADFVKVAKVVDPSWFALNQVVVMPKTALYHHERGRKFRPSRRELQTGKFTCPSCKKLMLKVRFRMGEQGYTCPRCNWCISRSDIWDPQQKELPLPREPGDITDLNEASNSVGVDISLDEMGTELVAT